MPTNTYALVFIFALMSLRTAWGKPVQIEDSPFLQDYSVQYRIAPTLEGAKFLRMVRSRDGIVYVLTDRGVARLFDLTLALDQSFRPLAKLIPVDIAEGQGDVYYLYKDQLLSNDNAGKFHHRLTPGRYHSVSVGGEGRVYLVGATHWAVATLDKFEEHSFALNASTRVLAGETGAWLWDSNHLWRIVNGSLVQLNFGKAAALRSVELSGLNLIVGSATGYFTIDTKSGGSLPQPVRRLPVQVLNCSATSGSGLWFGTELGVFRLRDSGETDYYMGRRWLAQDQAVDLLADRDGGVLVLGHSTLSRIAFKPMTLADKAKFYEDKIRSRHIRYGLCSELHLITPGDIASAEMIDTDNDGTWSQYYLVSQAFHFAVTGEESARRNAWEVFNAIERMESINGLKGFISRTFEREGFKYSDPDRWRSRGDGVWEWKGHTSSDEINAHMFGLAVLYETCAKTLAEKQRIAGLVERIIDHILRNNYYLIDSDGKPTLWGRWNPEYVNWYPPSIVDRRLNSSEIIGTLQLAFSLTGKEVYKTKANELISQHGYLKNIHNSLRLIAPTTGYIHLGNDMGDQWNHSDDELGFVSYWILQHYALTPEIRATAEWAVKDHWDIEKDERCPLWSFIAAGCGAKEYDPAGAAWTLRRFPLDLINWTVNNSHRLDITKLAPNFRGKELEEILPPSERMIMRWNGHPFVLNGGDGGQSELAGDEFLLPYWMGRYLGIIGAPTDADFSAKAKGKNSQKVTKSP